ncbi:MAG: MFS transporter [Pirellulales bacterium]|nr:MFS transporter [Pirellulales bacterium]
MSEVDRFRRAQWRMLLAVMGCYLFYYTGRQNFGFINRALQSELGLSATDVGTIGGGMLLAYGLGQAVNGGLADRFGTRRMMTLGALASAALNWAASFAGGYTSLLLCWTANGYAQSFGWAPGSKLIAEWWRSDERGRAFGFYTLAAGFSSVLTFALCLGVLYVLDWRWVLRLPVLLLVVAGLAFYRVARDRPQDLGFPPLEEEADELVSPVVSHAPQESFAERYVAVLTNGRFLVACAALGLESVARYGLLFWVPAHYLGEHWKQEPGAAWITLALPIGMALEAVTSGQISDRLFGGNRARPIAIWLALAAVVVLALAQVPREQTTLGLALLFLAGFLVYGPQACFWALCPDLLGRSRAGTGVGVMDAFAYGFAALGEVAIGRTIDAYQETGVMFYIVAGCCAAGAAIIPLVRR